ncbi:MAG: uracil-DNA glycosylase family protein [bacterium]
MTNKQKRMLELLDQQILNCSDCGLYVNGRCKPFWTPKYNGYFICGEAPGKQEIENNEPFIGSAGEKLWICMKEFNITKEECFIINSTNCRPLNGNKNGKPSQLQMDRCKLWIRKYFKVLEPQKIILLGNYALSTFLNEWGILKFYEEDNLFTEEIIYGKNIKVVKSLHPSMCIYKGEWGKERLKDSIKLFSEV